MIRRLVPLLALTAVLVPFAVSGQAAPSTAPVAKPGLGASLPDMNRLDPVRYSLEDAVVEKVTVPSRNGVDTIWVDIIRPRTKPGVRVPTIMDASPYFNTLGRGWQGDCKTPTSTPSVPQPLCPSFTPFPEFYDDYFVPRGYAVALMDLRGTRNTSGCQVYGDRDEALDGVDVVDWIADQPWSNGKVGLTGGSYDGTIANGVAVLQPLEGKHKDAVAAVVPIRAIDRWYDYHFLNGVPSADHEATAALFTVALASADVQTQGAEDPLTPARIVQRKACVGSLGALTAAGYAPTYQDSTSLFWDRRDYVKDARTTKAAFFLIHGLYDFNVKTNNVGHLWAALPKGAPKKLWLLNGDHVDPDTPDARRVAAGGHVLPFTLQASYRTMVHRWWAQYLKGLPAGADRTPTVEVQQGDGRWLTSRTWPVASRDAVLALAPQGRLAPSASEGTAVYADGAGTGPSTVQFVGAPATKATRLSGQVVFDLAYRLTGPDTSFTVRIDDLAPGASATAAPNDSQLDGVDKGVFTVSYGFGRAAYAADIKPRGISYPTLPTPVVPGATSRITFPSLPLDYVLQKGHRLRLTFGPDLGGTQAAYTGGDVTLLLGQSKVRLPVVP